MPVIRQQTIKLLMAGLLAALLHAAHNGNYAHGYSYYYYYGSISRAGALWQAFCRHIGKCKSFPKDSAVAGKIQQAGCKIRNTGSCYGWVASLTPTTCPVKLINENVFHKKSLNVFKNLRLTPIAAFAYLFSSMITLWKALQSHLHSIAKLHPSHVQGDSNISEVTAS